jgi:hypothetical protein
MTKTYTQLIAGTMMKKIMTFVALMTVVAITSFGQTASLENKTAFPGTTTSVNLDVTNLINVNAITFDIRYNPNVLSFVSVGNISPQLNGGSLIASAQDSTIHLVWYSPTASTVNGVLCKLNFVYNGTYSTLGFLPSSVVTQGTNTNLLLGYTNGSVSPVPCDPGTPSATLGSSAGVAGSPIMIPLNFASFPTAGAITQVIHYDASKLTFISGTKNGNLAGAIITGGNGVINIAWSNTLGADINTTATTWIKLNFMCVLPGDSYVSFAPGCIFSTPAATNINACYTDGMISQTPTTQTAILGSLVGVVQGDNIQIPLDLNISAPVSAFTLYINFNSPLVAFTGVENVDPLSSMVMTSVNGSTMTMVYTNPGMSLIAPGTFLKLKFKYNGIGTGYVNFTGACSFSDNLFQSINVAYTNATVAAGTYPPIATATIGSVPATIGSFVDIPVNIDGGTANPLGAATMFIGYDQAKLSFVSVVGNTYNATVNSSGNQISIAWADPAGVSLTGNLLSLRFQYQGGAGSGCASDLYFKNDNATMQPCEMAKNTGVFVPANWINGGVNLSTSTAAINGPSNPNTNTAVVYTTDAGMINYNWTATGGTITSGNGTPSATITWGTPGTGSILLSYTTPGGCNVSNTKNIIIVSGNPTTDLEGYVTYDNILNEGMNGVNITLFNSIGVQVGLPVSTITNVGHGYYQFVGIPQDEYTMSVSLGAPWAGIAGVSALDALIVELQTAGVLNPPLSSLNLSAGNVNGISGVNATDALLIKKRIIGEITSFPAGDWVFNNSIIQAFPGPVVTYNFQGLCTGDVNGSYNPVVGVKYASMFNVSEDEIMPVQVNTTFTYDLKSAASANLGAMTLFLGYNQEFVEITKINTSLDGLEYSIKNGKISIAWSNTASKQLESDGSVLSMQVRVKKEATEPMQLFTVLSGTEFASAGAQVLPNFNLKMAKIVTNSNNFSLSNYPNPFRNTANVVYSLPTTGHVRLVLTNMVGEQIATLIDGTQEAGTHSVIINPADFNLSSGIYLCQIVVETTTDKMIKTSKLIYNK